MKFNFDQEIYFIVNQRKINTHLIGEHSPPGYQYKKIA